MTAPDPVLIERARCVAVLWRRADEARAVLAHMPPGSSAAEVQRARVAELEAAAAAVDELPIPAPPTETP